jgi:outer membrane protein assembly factor BamC
MLYRLMTFLGSDEAKAKDKFLAAKEQQTIKVDLVEGTGGYAKLVFLIDEKETWNSVGWALDELNVDIDDKDVKERSFYIDVARTEDKGFFSNIFGDEAIKKTFQILVRRKDNNVTEVYFNDLTEENEQETIDFSHDFLGSIANLF